MFRILKPGGRLATTEIVIEPLKMVPRILDVLTHLSLLNRYKSKVGPLGGPATEQAYRRLARKAGFEITAIKDWAPHVVPTYASLKIVKRDEADSPGSVYAPRLLDFGARMMNKGAQKYLAVCFRKPG
jgi:hypothetical protein